MSRRVIAAGAAACVACACAAAAAQPAEPQPQPPAQPPAQPAPAEPQPQSPVQPTPAEPQPAPPAVEPPPSPPPIEPEPSLAELNEIGDQGIGGMLGIAAGGRTTAGGLRVTGHYLYQLSDEDWFDGIASFTFGGGDPACFRDRSDELVCDHGLASGSSVEVAAGVRRMFAPQGRFRPFARAAVGLAIVRFGGDDLTGIAIPAHAGAGLRAAVSPGIAVIALADATVGLGIFGRGLGNEPQLGLAITAGAELRLR